MFAPDHTGHWPWWWMEPVLQPRPSDWKDLHARSQPVGSGKAFFCWPQHILIFDKWQEKEKLGWVKAPHRQKNNITRAPSNRDLQWTSLPNLNSLGTATIPSIGHFQKTSHSTCHMLINSNYSKAFSGTMFQKPTVYSIVVLCCLPTFPSQRLWKPVIPISFLFH